MEEIWKKLEDRAEEQIAKLCGEIKDFAERNQVKRFYIGMSGGIDCAVTAALAKRAGIEVVAITMPFEADKVSTRKQGVDHAQKQCDVLNIPLYKVDISQIEPLITNGCAEAEYGSNPLISAESRLARANILPRVRMTVLYYAAQCGGGMVLGTGNLSEMTMGYFTKWGDGAYDFDPLETVTKTEVFILAKHLNIIPEIINKQPSADLWEGQTDEKEMGLGYRDIDEFILTGRHPDAAVAAKIKAVIRRNRHKFTGKEKANTILEQLISS